MSEIKAGMTKAGLGLLAKSQTGKIIEFTKIKIGNGIINNENISELNDLINIIDVLDIKQSEIIQNEDNSIFLKVTSFIKQAELGYYFREMGLFAIDPDTQNEILYGYLNKGDEATYIPNNSSPLAIQELATMIVAIGNTDNIIVHCDSELKIIEQIEGNGGYSLFDIVQKDHILTFEESEGFTLQGEWVYAEAIANERYGYPDFYNRCIEERNSATDTRTVLDNSNLITYNHANGHIFYNISDKEIIDTYFNNHGVAWFFGIDEDNGRILLPRNKYFFRNSSENVGGLNLPGLPSINHNHTGGSLNVSSTGTLSFGGYGSLTGTGPFKTRSGSTGYNASPNSSASGKSTIDFNLSASLTGSSSNNSSVSELYGRETNQVMITSTNALLYIVTGNVRQKNAVVLDGKLENAITAINNTKSIVLTDIETSKNQAVLEMNNNKTNAISDFETAVNEQIDLINTLIGNAQSYALTAQEQAEIAKRYASVATSGQIQTDWNQENENEIDYIKNKPNYTTEEQVKEIVNTEIEKLNEVINNSGNNNSGSIGLSYFAFTENDWTENEGNYIYTTNEVLTALSVYKIVNGVKKLVSDIDVTIEDDDITLKYSEPFDGYILGIASAITGSSGSPISQITKVSELENDMNYVVGIHKEITTQIAFQSWETISKAQYQNLPKLKKIWIPKELTKIEAASADEAPFLNCHEDCTIFTDVESAENLPSGWSSYFNNRTKLEKMPVQYNSSYNAYKEI